MASLTMKLTDLDPYRIDPFAMFQVDPDPSSEDPVFALLWGAPDTDDIEDRIRDQQLHLSKRLNAGDLLGALREEGKLAFYQGEYSNATECYVRYFNESANNHEHAGVRVSFFLQDFRGLVNESDAAREGYSKLITERYYRILDGSADRLDAYDWFTLMRKANYNHESLVRFYELLCAVHTQFETDIRDCLAGLQDAIKSSEDDIRDQVAAESEDAPERTDLPLSNAQLDEFRDDPFAMFVLELRDESTDAAIWGRPSETALAESILAQRARVTEALNEGDKLMMLWREGKLAFYENDLPKATKLYMDYFTRSAKSANHQGLRLSFFLNDFRALAQESDEARASYEQLIAKRYAQILAGLATRRDACEWYFLMRGAHYTHASLVRFYETLDRSRKELPSGIRRCLAGLKQAIASSDAANE